MVGGEVDRPLNRVECVPFSHAFSKQRPGRVNSGNPQPPVFDLESGAPAAVIAAAVVGVIADNVQRGQAPKLGRAVERTRDHVLQVARDADRRDHVGVPAKVAYDGANALFDKPACVDAVLPAGAHQHGGRFAFGVGKPARANRSAFVEPRQLRGQVDHALGLPVFEKLQAAIFFPFCRPAASEPIGGEPVGLQKRRVGLVLPAFGAFSSHEIRLGNVETPLKLDVWPPLAAGQLRAHGDAVERFFRGECNPQYAPRLAAQAVDPRRFAVDFLLRRLQKDVVFGTAGVGDFLSVGAEEAGMYMVRLGAAQFVFKRPHVPNLQPAPGRFVAGLFGQGGSGQQLFAVGRK